MSWAGECQLFSLVLGTQCSVVLDRFDGGLFVVVFCLVVTAVFLRGLQSCFLCYYVFVDIITYRCQRHLSSPEVAKARGRQCESSARQSVPRPLIRSLDQYPCSAQLCWLRSVCSRTSRVYSCQRRATSLSYALRACTSLIKLTLEDLSA